MDLVQSIRRTRLFDARLPPCPTRRLCQGRTRPPTSPRGTSLLRLLRTPARSRLTRLARTGSRRSRRLPLGRGSEPVLPVGYVRRRGQTGLPRRQETGYRWRSVLRVRGEMGSQRSTAARGVLGHLQRVGQVRLRENKWRREGPTEGRVGIGGKRTTSCAASRADR